MMACTAPQLFHKQQKTKYDTSVLEPLGQKKGKLQLFFLFMLYYVNGNI